MNIERADCRHLHGYKPCRFHKETRTACKDCTVYEVPSVRILIIKLGAAGEVIRNTPILHRLRQLYPGAEITWLTKFPELVPRNCVDRILRYDWEALVFLGEEKFDLLLSLDKENVPAALANRIKGDIKKGFRYSETGKILPYDADAERKWRTGIDDVEMLRNTSHYVEEIFEICGYQWSNEEYILPEFRKSRLFASDKIVVGINTGAGQLWRTRIPHPDKLSEIIETLLAGGYEVVLLGGPDEHEKNVQLQQKYGLHYFGVRSFGEFINIVDNCNVIVTPVTMALHIAIGLGKHVVLLNNIFNKHEFYLYGKGTVIEPNLDCLGCYKKDFDANCPVADCTLQYDTGSILEYLASLAAGKKK